VSFHVYQDDRTTTVIDHTQKHKNQRCHHPVINPPHHGEVWVEDDMIRARLVDQDNFTIYSKMVTDSGTQPREVAQNMCREHEVPIHGGELLDFKTIKP